MAVALTNLLLRILSDSNYQTKGSTLTWNELDGDLKLLADAIRDLQQAPTEGFTPYDNSTEYSNVAPDYVSFDGNIWEYVSAIPQSGITPGSDASVWQIASLGIFSHERNKDQYLDFGGANQVSAADLYLLLTAPVSGAILQGSNTLTEQFKILTSIYGVEISTGDGVTLPTASIVVTNGVAQLSNSKTDGKSTIVQTSDTGAFVIYQDAMDSSKDSSVSVTESTIVVVGVLQLNDALELQNEAIYWRGNKDSPAEGDIREYYNQPTDELITEKYTSGSWVFRGSR